MISRRRARALATLTGLALLGLSAWYLYHVLRHVDWAAVGSQITRTPGWRLAAASGLAAAGYLIVAGYDGLGLRYVGRRLGLRRTLLAGTISGAFSNTVAVPVLNVGGMRFRFYTAWGLSEGTIARLVAFIGLSSWLGLLLLAGFAFLAAPPRLPFAPEAGASAVRALGLLFLAAVAAYLVLCGARRSVPFFKWRPPLPSFRMAAAQGAAGAGDWLAQAGIVYVLIAGEGGVPATHFFPAYFAAMLAAMVGRSGGGFGIFEAGALYLLGPAMAHERLVSVLILYRVIYHFGPLLVAMLAYLAFETRVRLVRRPPGPRPARPDGPRGSARPARSAADPASDAAVADASRVGGRRAAGAVAGPASDPGGSVRSAQR